MPDDPSGIRPKRPRGFAALKLRDPQKLSAIASQGGEAAHRAGTAHEWSAEEASAAGRKGGKAPHAVRRLAMPVRPSVADFLDEPEEAPELESDEQ
jgi:general stress protein YciG